MYDPLFPRRWHFDSPSKMPVSQGCTFQHYVTSSILEQAALCVSTFKFNSISGVPVQGRTIWAMDDCLVKHNNVFYCWPYENRQLPLFIILALFFELLFVSDLFFLPLFFWLLFLAISLLHLFWWSRNDLTVFYEFYVSMHWAFYMLLLEIFLIYCWTAGVFKFLWNVKCSNF